MNNHRVTDGVDPAEAPAGAHVAMDAIEQRFFFAAWPQTYAHASWFDMLDAAVGLKVSRACGPDVGGAEEAVAQALLQQVGANPSDEIQVDLVPLWAMQTHAVMRKHLSTVAALSVLPTLKLAVGGARARQWDAVLGAGVRHAAMLLGRDHPDLEPPLRASGFRDAASEATETAADWERFCVRLGLTALTSYGAAVAARVRLAWPCALVDVQPLATEPAVQAWLESACGTAMRGLAT